MRNLFTSYHVLLICRNPNVTKSVENAELPHGQLKVHQNVRNVVEAIGKLYAYGGKMFLLAMLIAKTK